MPSYNDVTKEIVPVQRNNWNSDVITGSRVTGAKLEVWNAISSRPKPLDLIGNMTSMAEQRRVYTQSGISHFVNPSSGWTSWTYHVPRQQIIHRAPLPSWEVPLRLKIKSEVVNLGESIAEYRQTASMVTSLGRQLIKAYRSLRKGKFSALRRQLSTFDPASAWLLTQFGIIPLLNDIDSSLTRLNDKLEGGVYRRVSISAKSSRNTITSDWDRVQIRSNSTLRARAYIRIGADPPNFTLGNPVELGWELVPFSFVVDYFFSIGDYLSGLDALKDVTFLRGYYNVKTIHTQEPQVSMVARSSAKILKEASFRAELHYRTAFSNIPIGTFNYKPSLSAKKLVNLLALAVVLRR